MIELYNLLGTDVAVLGNHEFDFGPEVAATRIAESAFPWLGTNVLGPDGEPAIGTVASYRATVGDLSIGFFGVLTPETDVLSSPGPDITFAEVIPTASETVAALESDGADLIVALTHQTLARDQVLARAVEGIDLILGGHDHNAITYQEGETLIVKAGYDAHWLAAVDLAVERLGEGADEELMVVPAWRFLATAGVEPDPEVGAVVGAYQARLDDELGEAVGTTAVLLDTRRGTVRSEESNFGNLIADAIRARTGAEIGLTNGGGIRGDRTYPPGTTLTRGDVLAELPFGNLAVLIELSGADLLAALENGVAEVEEGAGRFPQVSGLAFTFDPSRPRGSRIVEVTVGGEPLDPAARYTVATNDYIYGGGDGYEALARGKAVIDPSGGPLMATVVMDHIAAEGEIAPVVEGRITRVE
jgi:2',3'-cyclic-nucleotide 2'-phosphodiesterase (5'-nucleotidase family)